MGEDWNALTDGVCFITDLGQNAGVGGMPAQRYAVWIPEQEAKGGHRIAEVGSNLQELRSKYGVEEEYVFQLQG
ncbi:MAG: hypothetical protein HFH36_09120 [Lachnospiraceae bacterium]|nr:hypothetical protein [Lachnospiraceae bacterium]